MVKRKLKVKASSKAKPLPSGFSVDSIADMGTAPLIPEAEWYAREQRYQQRIQDVKVCLGFITESIEDYKTLVNEQSNQEHWDRYLSCDGLPCVHDPSELRRFLSEIQHFEKIDEDSVINWVLSVDECSILTQEPDAKDRTRICLEQTLRPDIGKLYATDVERILTTWRRIDLLLANEYEMAELSAERSFEIALIRDEMNLVINLLFDKLTYRIICDPSAFKTQSEGITESYCYKCSRFNFQVWWLRDIPLRFQYFEHPYVVANLNCTGVTVQIPMSVLRDNLTLRCIHTFYDPYSENSKSFFRTIDKSPNELNAGLMDIEDCLINEWVMQVTIMSQIITRMEQRLILYEENQREIEIKNAKAAKGHKAKLLKQGKSPQKLPEGMFPDPYKYFIQQEQQDFDEFLDQNLSPKYLELKPDEINLRRFVILGGIFSLSFVHKPKHVDFPTFTRTIHDHKRELLKLENVRSFPEDDVVGNDDDKDRMAKLRSSSRSRMDVGSVYSTKSLKSTNLSRSLLQITKTPSYRNNKKFLRKDDDLNYFYVKIKLAKELCHFGTPVVCQYLDEYVFEELIEEDVPTEPEEHRNKKKRKKNVPTQKTDTVSDGTRGGSGASLESVSRRVPSKKAEEDESRYELSRPRPTLILPKLSIPQNIYRPSGLNSFPREFKLRHSVLPDVILHNFELNKGPMDSKQMHEMIKHCMPRILSSFKFPLEFKIEKIEALTERSKSNKILRRNLPVIYTDEPEYLSYEKQEAPERLFPLFDWREKVLYEQNSTQDSTSTSNSELQIKIVKIDQIGEAVMKVETPDESIYGIIQALEKIQRKYRDRALKLMEQANFLVRSRNEFSMYSPLSSGKPKTSVRISTLGSKLIHIPRLSRGQARFSNFDTVSFDSMESPQHSLNSVASGGIRHGRQSYSPREPTDKEKEKDTQKKYKKVNVKHWTTKHIVHSEFNRDTLTFTIKTDRLGFFGFAFKRYEHFPFRDWKLQQNEEVPNEIIFTLDTFYVRIILFINNIGIRGYVTKIVKEYVANPIKYVEIKEPISDYRELHRLFLEKNINIFAEHDACYYIENGYFSEKHLASELHIYDAFAVHCKLIKFYRSDWNRLAPRRDLILCLRNPKDTTDSGGVTVRVTPDASTFVEVSEPCSLDLNEIELHYQLTWRNIGTYSDLHQLINSMYPQATDVRNRDPKLIHYIRTLFNEVRPLSFS